MEKGKYIFTILIFVRFVKIAPYLWEGDDRKLLAILLNNFCSLCKMWWCIWLMPIIGAIAILFQLQLHHYYENNFEQVSHYLKKTDMIKYWNKKVSPPFFGFNKKQIRSNAETKSITSLFGV